MSTLITCDYCSDEYNGPYVKVCECRNYHESCVIIALNINPKGIYCPNCKITHGTAPKFNLIKSIDNIFKDCGQACLRLCLFILLVFSVCAWHVPNSTYKLAKSYKLCNHIPVLCTDNICNAMCHYTLKIFTNNADTEYAASNNMMFPIGMYWTIFIITGFATKYFLRHTYKIPLYLLTTIIINTIAHFIGSYVIYLANKPVHAAMDIISIYTLYIGFTVIVIFVLILALIGVLCYIIYYSASLTPCRAMCNRYCVYNGYTRISPGPMSFV